METPFVMKISGTLEPRNGGGGVGVFGGRGKSYLTVFGVSQYLAFELQTFLC